MILAVLTGFVKPAVNCYRGDEDQTVGSASGLVSGSLLQSINY